MNLLKFPQNSLIQIVIGTQWLWVICNLRSNQPSLSLAEALVAIYRCLQFLHLVVRYPEAQLVPNREIDAVIHILEQTPLFNRYFDHEPGLGTRGEADRQVWLQAFQTTREKFEFHFGAGSMGLTQPGSCQVVDYRCKRTSLMQPAACEICLKAAV